MSAFEVSITPTRNRNKHSETLQPTIVCMAPFSAKSIVQFEDVPLTKTAKRILRVINPSDEDIEVKVTKQIRAEHNVTIDWTEKLIPAQNEVEMEMIWVPLMDIVCKETLQLTDNRNFRKDVMVILKSRSPKSVKQIRKFPTISSAASTSHVRTMRLKSPTNGIKHKRTFVNTQLQKRRQDKQQTEKITTSELRNLPKAKDKGGKTHTITNSQSVSKISPLSESNLTSRPATKFTQNNLNVSPLLNNTADIPKENISPLTPNNVMDLIDNLNFTPATTKTTNLTLNIDNLAFLPTPINTTAAENCCSTVEALPLRPRKLAVDLCDGAEESRKNYVPEIGVETCEVATPSQANCSGIITNKTFEVKGSEDINCSQDSLNASAIGSVMNRTTTILCTPMGRTLTIIREEDDSSSMIETTNMDIQNHDLKRDIKLVGTPLRKHSESMKNLSWKSPQGKLPIQGSMPNLNEMETIRSIEQNRYFHQSGSIQQNQNEPNMQGSLSSSKKITSILNNCEKDNLLSKSLRTASQVDLNFNHSEILAQSSLFNLNEVGISKIKKHDSPNSTLGRKPSKTRSNNSPKTGAVKKVVPTDKRDEKIKTTKPGQKRSLHDLSFSDTMSNESLTQDDHSRLRVNRKHSLPISPPKRQRFDISGDHSFLRPFSVNTSTSRTDWSRTQPKKVAKLTKTLSLIKKPITPSKTKPQPRIKLYDPDLYLQTHINPDPFAATTTCDPFLTSTMYLDERAVEHHQTDFRKWLNALVTMPEDLDADSNTKIDVGKLFNEVRNKDLTLAPTKEEQSMNYLTKFRLESLRRAAVEFFFSEEMRIPCTKIAVYVSKQALRIRNDRNLHLDVVMQRSILELLLYFNPLWLRLGLEVVYGEKIHLQSNRDIIGLTSFILNRLFRDKFLEQKYSKAYTLSEEYAEHIKKFTLQKMLFLLLFLDKAKSKRIIKHNPCLFVKNSPYKETKEILLRFSSELLANIGDITRDLRRLDYKLEHKQNFLDEFDYAFNNLAVDLRDGVRLTRVMEIILLRDDLTQQLRVPAISRLQRLFNVKLALGALSEANFQLNGNIIAADIVDGHREKTLSLLWQIIYKFRSPKFHAAAKTIQIWWRRNWLRVVIHRRLKQKELQRKEVAATKIQALFRGYITRRFVRAYKEEREQAAIVLQKHIRRFVVQKRIFQENHAAIFIQRFYRAYLLGRHYRQNFLRLRTSVVFIQRIFRRRLLSRKLLFLADEARRQREQKRHAAAAYIQSYWRAWCETRSLRSQYLHLRQNVIILQQRYRARKQMQQERLAYLQHRQAAVFVQRTFRGKLLMRQQRQTYLEIRSMIIKLQRRRRGQLQMRSARAAYVYQREVIIKLQRRIRATFAMRKQREMYQRQRAAASILQKRYRAHVAMKIQFECYKKIRDSAITIQRKWRATILSRGVCAEFIAIQCYTVILQQKYRARKLMRLERTHYLRLRASTIIIQRRYRANRQMLQTRAEFQAKLQAAITLQHRFRAYKQMRFQRAKYQGTRAAALCLQQHIRSFLLTKHIRSDYIELRKSTICIQRTWRAKRTMRLDRMRYEQLRGAAITVQRRYRAKLEMQKNMFEYNKERQLIIALQRRWRATLLAREIRQDFNMQIMAIIKIQRRYRALREMRVQHQIYVDIRKKIMFIQLYYRSYKLMQRERSNYLQKRASTLHIQRWYRSILQMRKQKRSYDHIRNSVIIIQRKWRATIAAHQQQVVYIEIKKKIIFIQEKFRAILSMRKARQEFEQKKASAIVLQRRYRARLEMLKIRSQYKLIVTLTVCIQRKFRRRREMQKQRQAFLLLKHYTIHLQQKFRGKRLMEKERKHFQLLRKSITVFQAHARGVLARHRFQELLTPEMIEMRQRKRAAKVIQRFYRGYRVRKRFRSTALCQIRKNLKALKSTSTTMNSLRCKLIDSVRILRGCFSASEVLHVLHRLDRFSRTVPHLLISHCDYITTFCYGIMTQAIRSEVDKKILELCSRIILNLARYDRVSTNIFQKNGMVTIAQMLLRWCDKDSEIFNTLCTLIWVFAHCPKKRKTVRNFMTTPEAIYMLRETKKLVARKEKMKQNDRRLLSIGPQQQQFSNRAIPSLEPDYGIIHQKPYTFISSVYAFDTVLYLLDIQVS